MILLNPTKEPLLIHGCYVFNVRWLYSQLQPRRLNCCSWFLTQMLWINSVVGRLRHLPIVPRVPQNLPQIYLTREFSTLSCYWLARPSQVLILQTYITITSSISVSFNVSEHGIKISKSDSEYRYVAAMQLFANTYTCNRSVRLATESSRVHNRRFLKILLSNRTDCSLRYCSNTNL